MAARRPPTPRGLSRECRRGMMSHACAKVARSANYCGTGSVGKSAGKKEGAMAMNGRISRRLVMRAAGGERRRWAGGMRWGGKWRTGSAEGGRTTAAGDALQDAVQRGEGSRLERDVPAGGTVHRRQDRGDGSSRATPTGTSARRSSPAARPTPTLSTTSPTGCWAARWPACSPTCCRTSSATRWT